MDRYLVVSVKSEENIGSGELLVHTLWHVKVKTWETPTGFGASVLDPPQHNHTHYGTSEVEAALYAASSFRAIT